MINGQPVSSLHPCVHVPCHQVIDEIEIRNNDRPLPRPLLLRIVETLKVLVVRVYLYTARQHATPFANFLLTSMNSVLSNLFERHAREPLFDGVAGAGMIGINFWSDRCSSHHQRLPIQHRWCLETTFHLRSQTRHGKPTVDRLVLFYSRSGRPLVGSRHWLAGAVGL